MRIARLAGFGLPNLAETPTAMLARNLWKRHLAALASTTERSPQLIATCNQSSISSRIFSFFSLSGTSLPS